MGALPFAFKLFENYLLRFRDLRFFKDFKDFLRFFMIFKIFLRYFSHVYEIFSIDLPLCIFGVS